MIKFYCKLCKKDFERYHKPETCPYCNEKFYDKPENERILFHLQDKYYTYFDNPSLSQEYLSKMIIMIEEISRNLLISNLKKKGTFVSKEEIEDMTSDVVLKMLEYFRRPSFRIGDSFTGYIKQVILYPLYNKRKKLREKMEVSLFQTIKKDAEGKELTLQDKLKKQNAGYIYSEEWMIDRFQEDVQTKGMMEYIETIFTSITTEIDIYTALRTTLSITNYIEDKPEKLFDYIWSKQSNDERVIFSKAVWTIREFIQDEIVGSPDVISVEEYEEFKKQYKIKKEAYLSTQEESYYKISEKRRLETERKKLE